MDRVGRFTTLEAEASFDGAIVNLNYYDEEGKELENPVIEKELVAGNFDLHLTLNADYVGPKVRPAASHDDYVSFSSILEKLEGLLSTGEKQEQEPTIED